LELAPGAVSIEPDSNNTAKHRERRSVNDRLHQLPRTEPIAPGQLRAVAPGLWACPDDPLFGGAANTCGFLLQRQTGNAFVYSSSRIESYYDHIDELGGVAMVLLNHRDEAAHHVTTLANHYDAPVRAHHAEVDACTQRGVDSITPLTKSETRLGDDLVAIHTPGHTPGVVSYLWSNPADDRRYLFAGDTLTKLTFDHAPAVLGFHPYPGNTDDLRRTLTILVERPSDVLVPGLANGTVHAYEWNDDERRAVLDGARIQLNGS
jgi:glyoxylase-like metal-dependent hydrolase (beta-lactamase superfamily II)